jgi:hypothetical protein
MLTNNVHPTTIDGVKRLAAQIRRDQNLKHASALDVAARAANCENYRHALRSLPAGGMRQPKPYVLLTIYWLDEKLQHRCGRETLRIELSAPILDICSKSVLKNVRGFGNLRLVAEDHFVCDRVAHSQSYARQCLCTAERSVRFMESTGLRPARRHPKAYPKGLERDTLPNIDHATDWVDPSSGHYVLVDEPYGGAPDNNNREAWSSRTGWRVIKCAWPGMYNPYSCDLYIVADSRSGYDLDDLAAKIDAMPTPLLEGNWAGESAPSWETFVSPMGTSALHKRRARCHGTIYPAPSATSVPYSYSRGSSRRRPIGKLGIPGHIDAGTIIKAAMRFGGSYAANRRLSALRSTLEDWLSGEIQSDQLAGAEFFDVYYHETPEDEAYQRVTNSSDAIIRALGELKQKLQDSYTNCAPLRQQIHRIDMSISMIGKKKPSAL